MRRVGLATVRGCHAAPVHRLSTLSLHTTGKLQLDSMSASPGSLWHRKLWHQVGLPWGKAGLRGLIERLGTVHPKFIE